MSDNIIHCVVECMESKSCTTVEDCNVKGLNMAINLYFVSLCSLLRITQYRCTQLDRQIRGFTFLLFFMLVCSV